MEALPKPPNPDPNPVEAAGVADPKPVAGVDEGAPNWKGVDAAAGAGG